MSSRTLVLAPTRHLPSRNHHHRSIRPGLTREIDTLRHLVTEGMGANTLRALTSDLAYLQAWSLASTGKNLPWPAPEALALKFVAITSGTSRSG